MNPVLIFGAGKTGRGFAAHICHRSGLPFVLIDKDRGLVERLRQRGRYDVCVLENPARREALRPEGSYHIDDDWGDAFAAASLCFTAVFGNNLPDLALALVAPLTKRFGTQGSGDPLTIVTCENLTGAARALREAIFEHLKCDDSTRAAIDANVGFCEGIIFKTCLGPENPDDPDDSLSVRAEPVFELPCDAAAVRGTLPPLADLKPTANFSHQLTRKIYTYNAINAVITYLGARRGASWLAESARDPAVLRWARAAAQEASEALIHEFGLDPEEQQQWVERALAKFANDQLPDPLSRNGADPRRKLGRDDRLIGPARLAIRHGIPPRGLAEGILAAAYFSEGGGEPPLLLEYAAASGLAVDAFETILIDVCGLRTDEPLYHYLLTCWRESEGA